MNKRSAFTLVEILIVSALVCAITLLVHRIVCFISFGVARGNVDLQNLENARNAVNYMRRDFMVSSPMLVPNEPYSKRYAIKSTPIVSGIYKEQGAQPMQVTDTFVLLYKRTGKTTYETVSYEFMPKNKCILRTSSSGHGKSNEIIFDGIKKAEFKLYTLHKNLNPYIPLLWVDITVECGHGKFKRDLKLATTINGSIICQGINNLYWNDTR